MTASDVPVDELRRSIVEGLQRTVDKLGGGFAAPLGRHTPAEAPGYGAAVVCLGLGRIGGAEAKTWPCALSLALLEEMGSVLLGLEDGSSIRDAWGMPRTLNAADGLYALGRQLLLSHEALSSEGRLEALSLYSEAARRFAEALHAESGVGRASVAGAARALYPAAASFAALSCGLGSESRAQLVALAEAMATGERDAVEPLFVKASHLLLRGG